MMQNYPNPASETTTFKLRVKDDAVLTLKIIDIDGNEIDSPLKNKFIQNGTHEINYNVKNLAEGVYFAILEMGGERIQYTRFVVSK